MRAVLDASAMLALVFDEPGADVVLSLIDSSAVSTVNLSECIAVLRRRQVSLESFRRAIRSSDMLVEPFDASDAWRAGELEASTRSHGLSFGDRACIALAERMELPALTADRAWSRLDLSIEVQVIR